MGTTLAEARAKLAAAQEEIRGLEANEKYADRNFVRTTITIEVLVDVDDTKLDPYDLEAVAREISEGGASGYVIEVTDEKLTPAETRLALIAQGSDPSFLFGGDWEEE